MIFSYKARRSPSEVTAGIVEAADEQAALVQIRKLGYFPFQMQRRRTGGDIRDLMGTRLNNRDLSLFCRQMTTLIDAGVGLAEALKLVTAQVANKRFKEILMEIRGHVEGGDSLSHALSNYRSIFPPLLVSIVGAGEAGGMLAQVFERAAHHYESMDELKGKVLGALIYPAFLLLVGCVSIGVLVTFVLPKFSVLFAGFGQDLPLPTLMLLSLSRFMAAWWWLLLVAAAVMGAAFYRIFSTGPGKAAWDRFKLDLPLVGGLILKIETAKFARTLSALLANGVPMLVALGVVRNTLANLKVGNDIGQVRDAVEKGSGLGEALEQHTAFASTATSLVRIGESSGATPQMLEKIAAVYEREVDRSAKALTTLLEPVLIIAMGGCVAFIVMSILLPVFRLNLIVQ